MSMFSDVRLNQATQSTTTLQVVPFSAIPAEQLDTDPDFFYNPVTQTLNVPAFSIDDLFVDGDIEFSNTQDHAIFVDASAVGTAGRALTISSGDGGAANALLPGGDGGALNRVGGFGGIASAAQAGGVGGNIVDVAGFGGDGTATEPAGDGGNFSGSAGDAGADGGGGGGDGGDYSIDAGAATGVGTDGDVNVGISVARRVNIGRTGKLANFAGGIVVAETSLLKGQVELQAGLKLPSLAKAAASSPYVLTSADLIVLWTTTAGACAQTLPALAGVRGQVFYISKITGDVNAVTITPNGAETIGLAATLVLNTISTAQIFAPPTGTDWIIL